MTQTVELANKDLQTPMVNVLKTIEKERNKAAQRVENLRIQIYKRGSCEHSINKKGNI